MYNIVVISLTLIKIILTHCVLFFFSSSKCGPSCLQKADFPKHAEKLSVIRTDRHENLVRPKNILPVRKKSLFRVIYPSINNWAPDFVKSCFFTRNTPKMFAAPSARRNFLKCAPPNLKSWIRPCDQCLSDKI